MFYTSERNDGMKTISATMVTIIPMRTDHLAEKKSGGGGNSFIREMPAYHAGLLGCQRISFGVTADCGATIP